MTAPTLEWWLWCSILVFVRSIAFVAFLPAPFGRQVPQSIRIGLGLALAALNLDLLDPFTILTLGRRLTSLTGGWWLAWLVSRETIVGLGLAWMLSLVLVPVRLAGACLAEEIGLSMGTQASPLDQQPSGLIAHLLELFTTALFLGANVHFLWLWTLRASYGVLPVGGAWHLPAAELAVDRLIRAEELGILAVAPILVTLLLLMVFLLVVSRTAPQLNLFSFGMPLRSLAGCFALLLFLPELLLSLLRATELLTELGRFY